MSTKAPTRTGVLSVNEQVYRGSDWVACVWPRPRRVPETEMFRCYNHGAEWETEEMLATLGEPSSHNPSHNPT